jgi:hypothetical protein
MVRNRPFRAAPLGPHWEVFGGVEPVTIDGRNTLVVHVVHLFSAKDAVAFARATGRKAFHVDGRKRTEMHVPKRRVAKVEP